MPKQWPVTDGTFHLGINMAGAVSAGAYTAGVLDFLIEALDEWYKVKAAGNLPVPMHKVSIDVFSGASAGGMCAAISAAMVQAPFEHIHEPTVIGTTNRFYESWVNKIDIEWLLQHRDLEQGNPVTSLLDSTVIDEIAESALTPVKVPANPDYISDSLTLFLTLTNVRGVPFLMSGDASGSVEEYIRYYADRLQFEVVAKAGDQPRFPGAKPLPLTWTPEDLLAAAKPDLPPPTQAGEWPLLKDAAMATGAFPLFLKPRQIVRNVSDYLYSPWEPIADPLPAQVDPKWPLKADGTFTTLNVDGGVTNNDPFQLAHDYLAIHNPNHFIDPGTGELRNPPAQDKANCAVLTVAPFPANDAFVEDYSFDKNSSVLGMLPNLMTTLISQSRFLGESLSAVIDTKSYSRFVLAPSDYDHPGEEALQCGLLSAFGGFFERGFRAHDYQLGRRNCQRFLLQTFRLTLDNPVIAAGLIDDTRDAVIGEFADNDRRTMPIIPLCGSAVAEVPAPERAVISSERVDQIVGWVLKRMKAVAGPLIDEVLGQGNHSAAKLAADVLITTVLKGKVREALEKELSGVIAG